MNNVNQSSLKWAHALCAFTITLIFINLMKCGPQEKLESGGGDGVGKNRKRIGGDGLSWRCLLPVKVGNKNRRRSGCT